MKRLFFTCFVFLLLDAREEIEDPSLKKGNLTLPISQQLSPLLGFGQTTVDKGDVQFDLFYDYLKGRHLKFEEVEPIVLYGITDVLTFLGSLPIAVKFKGGDTSSSGLQDMRLQLEYLFIDEAFLGISVLGAVNIPTGSATKTPITGFETLSFFTGLSMSSLQEYWYFYANVGGVITVKSNNNTRFGRRIIYQGGIGRNIDYQFNQWYISWMVELDGLFSTRDTVQGVIDPDSGGNEVFLAPSLWFATHRCIVQFGAGFPIVQHFFGEQSKSSYIVLFNVAWTFK